MVGEWGIFISSALGGVASLGGDEDGGDTTDVAGAFDSVIATPAGNSKTDILFPPSSVGSLEVEVNATLANAITVQQNRRPAAPPIGFLFVDPVSFKIATSNKTDKTGAADVVKVGRIFSAAVLASADVSKGVIVRFDETTKQFSIDPAKLDAVFEFEASGPLL